ncbi:MAG: glycosyltransferase family 4 protein [Novosphingobium sp.]
MAKVVFLDNLIRSRGREHASLITPPAAVHIDRVALIGTIPPRRCGIASFTSDSRDALREAQPDLIVDVYAMDDGTAAGNGAAAAHVIAQEDAASYEAAAHQINSSGANVAWLQHEFGIFGGRDGEMVIDLIDHLHIPLVVTLHTILEKPSPNQRRITEALILRSEMLIVMAEKAREILKSRYGVPEKQIRVIPHGIPDRAYVAPESAKPEFDLEGRAVILTFGLLSPDKGIADMIEAMPAIVRDCPQALYLVLGATHPHIISREGETLRESLQARANQLGVSDHVRFVDSFVDLDLLTRYLQAADVYVTPYRNPNQITSGTLSYAIGLGKPVVATRYVHAQEVLADGTGILVPFRDPASLASAIGELLRDDGRRERMAQRAYRVGRSMVWERYGKTVLANFATLLAEKPVERIQHQISNPIAGSAALTRLTDGTGMFQHSRFGVADRNHGYCIDDNARALALVAIADDLGEPLRSELSMTYAAFIQHAWNPQLGIFRNFMHFDRHWLEDGGSDDSNGRTLWALSLAATHRRGSPIGEWANELYRESSFSLSSLHSLRATAFSVLAAVEMMRGGLATDVSAGILKRGAEALLAGLNAHRRPHWNWFEPVLAYDNCRLSEALIAAGSALGNETMRLAGLDTLDWIMLLQFSENGCFRPVGSESFGNAYAPPRQFDQQPLEALAAIEACIAAHSVQQDAKWIDRGEAAYAWFVGENDLAMSLADQQSGECCDGLTPQGRNANRGAESVLAWQMATRRIVDLRTAGAAQDKDFSGLETMNLLFWGVEASEA